MASVSRQAVSGGPGPISRQYRPLGVLHICTDFWPSIGGIENFVLELAIASRDMGMVPRVLCLDRVRHPRGKLPREDEVNGIPVRRIPFLDLKYYKPAWLPLKELSRSDILHIHGIGALADFAVATKRLHRRPIVVSSHGGIFHTTKLAALKRLYFKGVQTRVLARVDRVVACSRNDFDIFSPIAPRLALIENGVNTRRFRNSAKIKKLARRMVYVGRLARSKNIDALIRTFSELTQRGHDLELHIAGPDWEGIQPELEALVFELALSARVSFLGRLTDHELEVELASATYFLLPSSYEGFGISVIEAMAAGCIPIVNDIPSLRSLTRGGEYGAVVDFNNRPEAADHIERRMKENRAELEKAVKARAEEFSWQSRMPEWLRVYHEAFEIPGAR